MKYNILIFLAIIIANISYAQIKDGVYRISNGSDCGIQQGAIRIDKIKNGTFSFAFAIDGPEMKNGDKMEGRIKGTAKVTGKNTAQYKDSKITLNFTFKDNKYLDVKEVSPTPNNFYHGAGICFTGTFKID